MATKGQTVVAILPMDFSPNNPFAAFASRRTASRICSGVAIPKHRRISCLGNLPSTATWQNSPGTYSTPSCRHASISGLPGPVSTCGGNVIQTYRPPEGLVQLTSGHSRNSASSALVVAFREHAQSGAAGVAAGTRRPGRNFLRAGSRPGLLRHRDRAQRRRVPDAVPDVAHPAARLIAV